ncbi:beta-ketoacyl synthase N-terminal-like domain-containing protein [Streptomyces sp. NPDC089919]|uniref:beta-ketoacyl synthase N-terminal-like domain-containing protein n=1 Tax=Streptomyces sp. NPDC089919 TaxID=3155188 RepID=UPI00344AA1DE
MRTPNPSPPATGLAVTAVGAVTASGTSVAALFDDLLAEHRPFAGREVPLVANAMPGPPGERARGRARELYAGHVQAPLGLAEAVGARTDRTLGRDSRLLVYAMHTTGAPLAAQEHPATDRTGVVLGTLHAGRNEYIAIHDAADGNAGPVNPVWGPQSGYNAPAAQLSIQLAARGPNLTLSSGATAGLDAVVTGALQIRAGVCDTVVAAGLDTLSAAAGAPAPGPGAVPEGEAAAVLVLEEAAPGDARVRTRLLGTGQAAGIPAAGPGAPLTVRELADAAEEAVRAALAEADRDAAEVGLAVTTAGDAGPAARAEAEALAAVFGPGLPACNATSTTGRTGGADGVIAVAVAAEALARGIVPPAAGSRPQPVAPTGPLALCLSVDRGGKATAVLVGGTATERGETA